MKKFNYKEVGKEIGWSFAKMNYSVNHLSDYDYYKEVIKYITPTTKCWILDVGVLKKQQDIIVWLIRFI